MPVLSPLLSSALKGLGTAATKTGVGLNKFKDFAITGAGMGGLRSTTKLKDYPGGLMMGAPAAYFGATYGVPFTYGLGKGGVTAAGQQLGMMEDPNKFSLGDAKSAYAETKRLLNQKRQEQYELHQKRQEVSQNAAILASTAPHLYNQILAGRRLPKGATVLGGAPRTDLLEELAYNMSQGHYATGSPSNMPSEYIDFNDLF